MRTFISIILLVFHTATVFSAPVDSSVDRLAADNTCAVYRTGEIDPAIKLVPYSIQTNVFINPEEYLPRLVEYLQTGAENDFHTVKRIHDWITDNIAYDDDFFYGIDTSGSREVYSLLKLKRTTCGGYSRLFKEMAELAGLNAVYIFGYAKTYLESDLSQGDHAWNAVQINSNWYIVDTTHDGRITYFNGEFGEKEEYSDSELFITPEAKILINYPEENNYQFLDSPVSFEEFLETPQFRINYLNYGISMITDLRNLSTVYLEERPGGKLQGIYNGIETQGKEVEIKINCPDNVKLYCNMFDEDGNRIYNHTFNYREDNTETCVFSAPDKGVYRAYIYASYTNGESDWQSVYGFRLIESYGSGPALPIAGKIYKNSNYYTYGLKITNSLIEGNQGYYKLEIAHPDNVSVVSSLRDIDNNIIEDSLEVSVLGNVRTYYYSMPSNGTFFIKAYAKNLNEESHNTAVTIKIDNENGRGINLPPPGEKIFYKRFDENGFEYISDNHDTRKPSDPYIVSVKCPSGYTMNCRTRDINDENIEGRYVYSRDNDIYTFYFSSPGEYSTARIYQIDSSGTWNTVLKFNLDNNTEGPALPLTNILYIKNAFYKNELELVYSNVNLTFGKSTYLVKIECSENMEMAASLRDENSNLIREHYIYQREDNTYIFFFSSPGEGGPYFARIYARDLGAEKYDYTNAEFIISSPEEGETFR